MTKQPGESAKPKAKKQRDPKAEKLEPKASQFSTESVLRDVHRAIEGRDFGSIEELNAYLATTAGTGFKQSLREARPPLSPEEEAQELAWDAMDAETEEQARKLAKLALTKDPDCVDALLILADIEAHSAKEAIAAVEKAVEAGERTLGKQYIAKNTGYFWGLVETRPYMRALLQLAVLRQSAGHLRIAIRLCDKMLKLNPTDNQGVREMALGCYLAADDLAGAQALLQHYKIDESATFLWGRVLERFLGGDRSGARRALKKAREANGYVELYMSGLRPLPAEAPETYTLGSEAEALCVLENLMQAWAKHQKAIFWLLDNLNPLGIPKVPHAPRKKKEIVQ